MLMMLHSSMENRVKVQRSIKVLQSIVELKPPQSQNVGYTQDFETLEKGLSIGLGRRADMKSDNPQYTIVLVQTIHLGPLMTFLAKKNGSITKNVCPQNGKKT